MPRVDRLSADASPGGLRIPQESVVAYGKLNDQLTYILSAKGLGDRERKWGTFLADSMRLEKFLGAAEDRSCGAAADSTEPTPGPVFSAAVKIGSRPACPASTQQEP